MKEKNNTYKLYFVFAWIFGITGLLFFIGFWGILIFDKDYTFSLPLDLRNASYIGSFLGGAAGSLWALVGLILLFVTLKIQRDELKETRETMELNRFETTYFNLISQFQSILTMMGNIEPEFNDSIKANGRIYMDRVFGEIKNKMTGSIHSLEHEASVTNLIDRNGWDWPKSESKIIIEYYDEVYRRHSSNLGHYFRYLYNIFKFVIKESDKSTTIDSKKYINLIQAQMSNAELGMLMMNLLSVNSLNSHDEAKFKNWVYDFGFLENIDNKYVLSPHLKNDFPKTKFKYVSER